jgi:hypothetical protein
MRGSARHGHLQELFNLLRITYLSLNLKQKYVPNSGLHTESKVRQTEVGFLRTNQPQEFVMLRWMSTAIPCKLGAEL